MGLVGHLYSKNGKKMVTDATNKNFTSLSHNNKSSNQQLN